MRLKNIRLAGEFASLLDDATTRMDYSGYCLASNNYAQLAANNPHIFCGWAYNGYQKGLLYSTRYEVEVSNPQNKNTEIQAFYTNTANDRLTTNIEAGTYINNLAQNAAIDTWSDPNVTSGPTNNNPHSWVALCRDGELAANNGNESTTRTNENYNCSYSYVRQQYSQISSYTNGAGNSFIRFKVRNGFAPPTDGQLNVNVTNTFTSKQIPTTYTNKDEIPQIPDTDFAYFYLKALSSSSVSINDTVAISGKDTFSTSATLGVGSVVNLLPNVVPKAFSVAYLRPEGSGLTTISGLNATTGLNVVNNPTFTAPRPPATSGVLFKSWELRWCSDSSTANCTEPVHKVNRTTTNTDVLDKNGDPIYTITEADGGEYPTILPGEKIDIRDIWALTDSKGDSTANQKHNHLALVATETQVTGQPPLYGYTKKLDDSPNQPIINQLFTLFRGTPGLTATVKQTLWDNATNRADVTYNNKTYKINELLSKQTTTLDNSEFFPVYLMFTPGGFLVNQQWVIEGESAIAKNVVPEGFSSTLSIASGTETVPDATFAKWYQNVGSKPLNTGGIPVSFTPTATMKTDTACHLITTTVSADDNGTVPTGPDNTGAFNFTTEATNLNRSFTATFIVNCTPQAELKVIREYQGIPNATGILTDSNSTSIDPWRAGTESDSPVTFSELANPTTNGDTKTYASVTEGSYILDSAAKADSYFTAPLSDWTCLDTDNPDTTINVSNPTHSSATRTARGTVALSAETKATCTTTYGSTGIAALAKAVASSSGSAPSLDNAKLTFTALSEDGSALTTLDSRNKLIDSTNGYSTQLTAGTTATSSNAVIVRPGIGLKITADGVPGGVLYKIQGLKDNINVGDQNYAADANWEDLEMTNGAVTVAAIPGHRFLAYRIYAQPAPTFPLPLTGGRPADLVLLAGAVLAAVGAATGVGMSRRKAHTAQL